MKNVFAKVASVLKALSKAMVLPGEVNLRCAFAHQIRNVLTRV